MKILAIRLKNLASLAGPFELDFTAEPLASAGLFAITGPTGAGKSTILDALCLALFGAVPRLSRAARDAKVPDAEGEIATGDPRTLLRRGTGNGFAEVDFLGTDGRRYRARWEANRAREKAGGKLQPSKQSLIDLDSEQVVASQKREYEVELEARLGLNFEQFTRAVLLAQSEFSAFLKASDNERSELLEKLTDTALYTQLGKRAFERSRDAANAHKALQDQAGHNAPLAVAEREALDQAQVAALQSFQAAQAHLRQLERQVLWEAEGQRLLAERDSAGEQLQQARADWDRLGPDRQQQAWVEQLAPQRHLFVRQIEIQEQVQPLAEQIAQQHRHNVQLQARHQQLHSEVTQARGQLDAAVAEQNRAAPLLRQAFSEQRDLTRLEAEVLQASAAVEAAAGTLAAGRTEMAVQQQRQQHSAEQLAGAARQLHASSEMAQIADSWVAYRSRLQQAVALSGRLIQGRTELPGLDQRAQQALEQLSARQHQLDALYQQAECPPDELNGRVQQLAQTLHGLGEELRSAEQLQRDWLRLDDLALQRNELVQQQLGLAVQREQRTVEGKHVKNQQENARLALEVVEQLLARQRLARSASVEQLRNQLQTGQPCPVCGSAEHPWHAPQALIDALAEHENSEETTARQAFDALTTRLTELRVEVTGLIEQQKRNQQQEQQLLELHGGLSATLAAHPLYSQLPETEQAIWLGNRLQTLQRSSEEQQQQQRGLLTLQQSTGQLQLAVQQGRDEYQQATALQAEQTRQLQADEQRLGDELGSFAELLPAAVIDGLHTAPTPTFMALDQQVGARVAQLEQQHDEQQTFNQRQTLMDQQALVQQSLEQQWQVLQQGLQGLETQRTACAQRLAQLLGSHTDAEHWQAELDTAVAQARSAETNGASSLQNTVTEAALLASELKAREQHRVDLLESLRALEVAIGLWRKQHPALTDSALQGLLAEDQTLQRARHETLLAAEKTLEQLIVRVQEREQRWVAHQAQLNAGQLGPALQEALAQIRETCALGEEQCADLRARQAEDQRRLTAGLQLQVLIDTALEEYRRWARIAELIGSREGDRFRKIAQAYNLDLLVHHANVQLRQLVRRYRLKRGGSSLGLLVMDTEMGDELRSVHSLSGGETFLVSLALALGLASMASSTLKIESLFIDEGFGSLDPESLQLAMDALDGLQAQGRKVAVISHVQEMHERIPVQIQVKRLGNGLSAVDVVG